MGLSTTQAINLATEAHQRLAEGIAGLTDEQVRQPSLLPDWTVAHLLTHIARNADGHAQRLEGALRGEEVRRYPGGPDQRNGDIEAGAARPAAELKDDIATSSRRLEAVWQECEAAGWPHADLRAGDPWDTPASPARRLREVELHHVDLGLGYTAAAWSDDYSAWELGAALRGLPDRLDPLQTRAMVLWLTGRTATPDVELGPWL